MVGTAFKVAVRLGKDGAMLHKNETGTLNGALRQGEVLGWAQISFDCHWP